MWSSATGRMIGDPVSARLLRPYLETEYEAGGVVARIGRRSPAIDGLLLTMGVQAGVFVTAWNPLSRRMSEGWNRRMQTRLLERLRSLPSVAGHGTGRRWSEQHLLVGAAAPRILVVARLFRQRAVVLVRRSRPARLMVLGSFNGSPALSLQFWDTAACARIRSNQ